MKSPRLSLACLVAGLCCLGNASANDDYAAFIESCKQTNYDYAMFRDRFDADGFASTFTEDGEIRAFGNVIKGREALAANIDRQRGNTFDRHVVSNIEIIPTDDTNATGTVYTNVYQARAENAEKLPPSEFTILMVVYKDTYRMTPDGCKFALREPEANFIQNVSN